MHIFIYCFILLFAFNYQVLAQNEESNTTVVSSSTSYSTSSTIKPPSNTTCETYHNDCKACVEHTTCYYCISTKECHRHFERAITEGECDMTHAYFMTCKANFKILLIIVGTLSLIVVLIITIVCCYCCCKKKGIKLSKDDIKWARQREERKQIAAERRKERAERTEEIRKKYGLVKDSNPYQRFDA